MLCCGALRPAVKSSARPLVSVSSTFDSRAGTVGPFQVFDRNAKRLQKDRAASRDGGTRSRTVDYVRNEVADRMMERLLVPHWILHASYVNRSLPGRIFEGNSILSLIWVPAPVIFQSYLNLKLQRRSSC